MPQVINTNISSLNAQRNLNSSQSSLATSLQRLSTGLRINSAKDDAAGFAIADRMSAQIKGLNQAARNANDGISLAQTAEGALGSVGDALQRMRELAAQASNATNSASDRASLQKEVDQLVSQINTVADQTSFNGVKLLDGTFNSQSFQVGANKGETISIASITSAKADSLGVGTNSSYSTTDSASVVTNGVFGAAGVTVNGFGVGPSLSDGVSTSVSVTGAAATGVLNSGDLKINGVATTAATTDAADVVLKVNALTAQTGVTATQAAGKITLTSKDGKDVKIEFAGATASLTTTGFNATTYAVGSDSAIAKAAAFNAVQSQTGVSATVTAATRAGTAVDTTGGIETTGISAGDIKINGVDIGKVAGGSTTGTTGQVQLGSNIAAAINAVSNQTGVTAAFSTTNGAVTLTAADGRTISTDINAAGAGKGLGVQSTAANQNTYGGIKISSTSSAGITLAGSDLAKSGTLQQGYHAATATFGAGVSAIDLTTVGGAQNALATIDAALNNVNASRASLGAIQNRFSSVVSNLQTTSENLTASRSRIQDADFAAETASLSRGQILQQAGTAMLAQANSLSQNVLSLLRG